MVIFNSKLLNYRRVVRSRQIHSGHSHSHDTVMSHIHCGHSHSHYFSQAVVNAPHSMFFFGMRIHESQRVFYG